MAHMDRHSVVAYYNDAMVAVAAAAATAAIHSLLLMDRLVVFISMCIVIVSCGGLVLTP